MYQQVALQNEFVKYDDKDGTLRITSKGLHFLEMYKRLPEFVQRGWVYGSLAVLLLALEEN
jgi:predicted transcriptional regulator